MKIFPISDLYFPLDSTLTVDGAVNPFGSGYEQRIITDYPRGPRADGEGNLTTYVGNNTFNVVIRNLKRDYAAHPTNAHIRNSMKALWKFYKECFYDPLTGQIKWDPFYFYNLTENDNLDTWTGDVVSAGMNSFGEIVSNRTGRYLVRFVESTLNLSRFRGCLFSTGLALVEVAE